MTKDLAVQVSGKVVCIDAGHGGRAPGAVGPSGLAERDVVWPVACAVGAVLRSWGHTVVFTRPHQRKGSTLGARAVLANAHAADAFVSLHADSARQCPEGDWSSIFFHHRSEAGKALAKAVRWHYRDLVDPEGMTDVKIKPNGSLAVLRLTRMPAILVELAFICSAAGETRLASPYRQAESGLLIAHGIDDWLKGKTRDVERRIPSIPSELPATM